MVRTIRHISTTIGYVAFYIDETNGRGNIKWIPLRSRWHKRSINYIQSLVGGIKKAPEDQQFQPESIRLQKIQ